MLERVKRHFKDHKEFYIGIGIGVGFAGVTYLIMKNQQSPCDRLSGQRGAATTLVDNAQVITDSSFSNSTIINHQEIHNHVKRLSYIVSRPETGDWWRSQTEAAKALGISETRISSHLNHGEALADGIQLVREGVSNAA